METKWSVKSFNQDSYLIRKKPSTCTCTSCCWLVGLGSKYKWRFARLLQMEFDQVYRFRVHFLMPDQYYKRWILTIKLNKSWTHCWTLSSFSFKPSVWLKVYHWCSCCIIGLCYTGQLRFGCTEQQLRAADASHAGGKGLPPRSTPENGTFWCASDCHDYLYFSGIWTHKPSETCRKLLNIQVSARVHTVIIQGHQSVIVTSGPHSLFFVFGSFFSAWFRT